MRLRFEDDDLRRLHEERDFVLARLGPEVASVLSGEFLAIVWPGRSVAFVGDDWRRGWASEWGVRRR